MTTRIRSLNATGCDRFCSWIVNPIGSAPKDLLQDSQFSEDIEAEYLIDPNKSFSTSYEIGEYLHAQVFKDVTDRFSLLENRGMWAWISLAMMNSLVKRGGKNNGLPLAKAHYVDAGPRLAYRLITRTAWHLVSLHGSSAKVALGSKSTPWGEMAEQMTASQEIFVHPSFWLVASRLYLAEDGSVRKGATSQRNKKARKDPNNKAGLGGVRRLPRTFKQFDRTYNTRAMAMNDIVELLPKEYGRWRG